MIKYFTGFFHIVIIAIFLGCGYKAPPTWESKEDNKVTKKDLQIIDLNSTLEIKIDK